VRDNQSATKVNTIRPGKLASLLAKGEAKPVERRDEWHSQSTEKGGQHELVGWLVAEWESKC
jgi:hypothetical protein